jgi:signal transduction histidine kinase
VQEAQPGAPVASGTVYFAPPGYHLLVEADRTFALSCDPPVLFSRPSIDVLLESCADVYGPELAGIVLTGANEDGARGLAAIKARGGLTAVQDPEEAAALHHAAARRSPPPIPISSCRWRACAACCKLSSADECHPFRCQRAAGRRPAGEPGRPGGADPPARAAHLPGPLGRRSAVADAGAPFALAILDVQMPSMNGFELAELMRGTERTRGIPIVFVSAAGRELNYAFRGYETGAVDFLYKPLDPHAVRSKVTVFVDLFRQRQELQAAQGELERAVTMRDDFMSMVSHELRNPLNSVYLQAQLRRKMLSGPTPPDRATMLRMVERDERQIRSMIRLLDDMLDVSRLRTGRAGDGPEALRPGGAGPAGGGGHFRAGRAGRHRGHAGGAGRLPLEGDEFRIEQVITNLLTNALRYGDGKPVAVTVSAGEGRGLVSVRDQGMGIAPADQERIFQQFERTAGSAQVPGLGLGLYIARQIVEAHRGRLEVSSELGQGSEFVLYLPLPGAAAAA